MENIPPGAFAKGRWRGKPLEEGQSLLCVSETWQVVLTFELMNEGFESEEVSNAKKMLNPR